ncbi:hypothetical protein R3P38DRAFT_2799949 [Favolaschia claudopus]|uniref:Uncharacterized protein n=1 Tax=Favolaschia claudopus TaxID=2862362 RepID=A0AAV9ZYR1_9AGAR
MYMTERAAPSYAHSWSPEAAGMVRSAPPSTALPSSMHHPAVPASLPQPVIAHQPPPSLPRDSTRSRKRAGSDTAIAKAREPKRSRSTKPKSATAASKPKPKSRTKPAAEKENLPVFVVVDSDDEVERKEDGSPRVWTAEEKSLGFLFVLGADDDAQKRFDQMKTNPLHVCKRMSELIFKGRRTPRLCKYMWGSDVWVSRSFR